MKFARIIYHEENPMFHEEGYAIELRTEDSDEWELDTFFTLFRKEGANDSEGKDYIRFTIIAKIFGLKDQGYEIIFM